MPYHVSDTDAAYIIAHERSHIRRKDHWWKPFGFLLLTLHWFNPLIWIAYLLLCRDIELACDEKVIKEMDHDQKADYSQALLVCSGNRRTISACPLAFGEIGVKNRVKSVLKYKKPALWIISAAITLCVVLAVCTLTDPISSKIEGPLACKVKKINEDGTLTQKVIIDYTEEGVEKILSVLNHGQWLEEVTNCACDGEYFEFRTRNETIEYHPECGTFTDTTHGRSFTLSEADIIEFNKILGINTLKNWI